MFAVCYRSDLADAETSPDPGAAPLQRFGHDLLPPVAPRHVGIGLIGFARSARAVGGLQMLRLELQGPRTPLAVPSIDALGTRTNGVSLPVTRSAPVAAAPLPERRRT